MEVAIVGAGPGGASAAVALARGGARVRLFERARWPRDKTCGDAVTPDGIADLATLGVALPDGAIAVPTATVVAPGGARAVGRWNGVAAVVRRRRLDAAIVDAALAHGAIFSDATEVRSITPDGTLTTGAGSQRFDAIVLAEGATGRLAGSLDLGGFGERQVAVRAYAEPRAALAATHLVVYGRIFGTGGYGWLFPDDDGRANVGVCIGERLARRTKPRALLDAWLASDLDCRMLLGDRPRLDDVRGGVIPTGRPRRRSGVVRAVGDAAGVADPLSAEGVSQAIASGHAVARDLLGETGAAERDLRAHDRNAREARRMRALFPLTLGPMIRLASVRPRLADHLVATGFTLKTDAAWFHGARAALFGRQAPR